MKYTGTTISKPVSGKSAERLAKALKADTYVSNNAAQETIRQIIDNKKKPATINATKNQI